MLEKKWGGVGWALGLVCAALVGCGGDGGDDGGGGQAGAAADDAGFRRLSGLGERCRAAVSTTPAATYGPLRFIPCTTGETRCEEVAWGGTLTWNPTGSGDMMEFHPQPALDAQGRFTKLLARRHYPRGVTQAIPFEAVAYDVATGQPLAAWRNGSNTFEGREGDGSGGRDCEIDVGISDQRFLLIGQPTGGAPLVFSTGALDRAPDEAAFRPLPAEANAFESVLRVGYDVAAVEQADGKLVRVDLASGTVAETYGPSQRLWLDSAAGAAFVARDAQLAPKLFRWGADGAFAPYQITGQFLRGDGVRFAWVRDGAEALEIVSAPDDGGLDLDGAARVVATVPSAGVVRQATLGDGVFALHVEPLELGTLPGASELYLVDLATGATLNRRLEAGKSTEQRALFANSSTHVWLGTQRILGDEAAGMTRVARVDLRP